MREVRHIMGMPVQLEIVSSVNGLPIPLEDYEFIFSLLQEVDETFSTYKEGSEMSRIQRNEIPLEEYSREMKEVLQLGEQTRKETNGYFDINTPSGKIDPSGIVKGWALQHAADQLRAQGYENFYLEIAGDIQVAGHNAHGEPWSVGILNPFTQSDIIKVIYPGDCGVATSGTYARGLHIYNPHDPTTTGYDVVSLTVIARNIYDADRFATAAFAMGLQQGLAFLEALPSFEAYGIDPQGIAHMTSGFERFTAKAIH